MLSRCVLSDAEVFLEICAEGAGAPHTPASWRLHTAGLKVRKGAKGGLSLVKGLLCEHENLSSIPGPTLKSRGVRL